nr:hypothetical protein CFP56_32367 [Quercus suber]
MAARRQREEKKAICEAMNVVIERTMADDSSRCSRMPLVMVARLLLGFDPAYEEVALQHVSCCVSLSAQKDLWL